MHPIHKAFLYFYQAICYESLGQIAHNYSSNKIPLLEQARDALLLASEILPTAALDTINYTHTTCEHSPFCATSDVAALYGTPAPSSSYTTRSRHPNEDCSYEEDCAITPTPDDHVSQTYSIPDSDEFSLRETVQTAGDSQDTPNTNLSVPAQNTPSIQNHKKRLSRSLSSKHALAEELVPSPLFSRGPSSRKESRSSTLEDYSPARPRQLTQVALCKPLPPLPPSRPLPLLPFNHNPFFVRKGKRFVVVPRRKTALSTLISKFEGKGPFDDITSPHIEVDGGKEVEKEKGYIGRTPVTERFNKISAVFAKKEEERSSLQYAAASGQKQPTQCDHVTGGDPDSEDSETASDKENIDPTTPKSPAKISTSDHKLGNVKIYPFCPATPCPRPKPTARSRAPSQDSKTTTSTSASSLPLPTIHLPTAHPSPIDTDLSTDHTALYAHHLTTLPALLTSHIQRISHTITKTHDLQLQHDIEKRARFAKSYTSASASASSSPNGTSQSKTKTKPLHSFWSLQAAENVEDKRMSGKSSGSNEKDEAKRERIRRLKQRGWDVRKERVGFKGVEYYGRLVDVAEREISGGVSG